MADAWLALATLGGAAAIYARGWWTLSRRTSRRFGVGRLAAFLGGLAVIAIALASPLDTLAGRRLSAHMVQHQLLMMLAPPLLWLGAPVAPMLLGLPRPIRRLVAVALASRFPRLSGHIQQPAVGWVSFALAFWTWHAAPLYELALRSHAWHHVEHACFFGSAMLFWWPVILPWPARSAWPRWTMIPYLLLADLQNTILAAILTLSDRLVYPRRDSHAFRPPRLSRVRDRHSRQHVRARRSSDRGRDHVGTRIADLPRRGHVARRGGAQRYARHSRHRTRSLSMLVRRVKRRAPRATWTWRGEAPNATNLR